MNEPRRIAIDLPGTEAFRDDDLEVLRTTLQTIVTLSMESRDEPCESSRRMHREGWDVHWGLTWIARARRGGVTEEATGSTRSEVLARLQQLTSLHEVDGCP
ncbi:MAG: hypothetical protein IPI34_04210 [bacterium]|nr:hypothetical protein [bacterium]